MTTSRRHRDQGGGAARAWRDGVRRARAHEGQGQRGGREAGDFERGRETCSGRGWNLLLVGEVSRAEPSAHNGYTKRVASCVGISLRLKLSIFSFECLYETVARGGAGLPGGSARRRIARAAAGPNGHSDSSAAVRFLEILRTDLDVTDIGYIFVAQTTIY